MDRRLQLQHQGCPLYLNDARHVLCDSGRGWILHNETNAIWIIARHWKVGRHSGTGGPATCTTDWKLIISATRLVDRYDVGWIREHQDMNPAPGKSHLASNYTTNPIPESWTNR